MKNGLGWFTGVGIAILLLVVGNVLYTCTRNIMVKSTHNSILTIL